MKSEYIELKMPWISPEETLIEVKQWLIKPGDSVEIDQDILWLLVERDPFILPAPFDASLVDQSVQPGELVTPGQTLAIFKLK